MTRADFDLFKSHQYCDTPSCTDYGRVGAGNICTKTFKNAQIYCRNCRSAPFSVRRGTMLYNLKTPLDRIVRVLTLLSEGVGVNAVCRLEKVDDQTLSSWLVLAATHVSEFSAYMQNDLELGQVQIDEFWSFVGKKKRI
jgi:transposase-like protein